MKQTNVNYSTYEELDKETLKAIFKQALRYILTGLRIGLSSKLKKSAFNNSFNR